MECDQVKALAGYQAIRKPSLHLPHETRGDPLVDDASTELSKTRLGEFGTQDLQDAALPHEFHTRLELPFGAASHRMQCNAYSQPVPI